MSSAFLLLLFPLAAAAREGGGAGQGAWLGPSESRSAAGAQAPSTWNRALLQSSLDRHAAGRGRAAFTKPSVRETPWVFTQV